MVEEPRIRHLCSPVLVWLMNASPILEDAPVANPHSENMPHKGVIDRLLLIVQNILSLRLCSPSLDLDQPPDRYVSDNEVLSGNLSQVLAVESVKEAVDATVDHLVGCPPSGRLAVVQTIIRFLDPYLGIVQNYLHVQCKLVKSSFKLSYILCRVVQSVAQKGFCKPAQVDDDSTGHARQSDELLDGTGLGQGTGSKDVSDQIQDESQVEGLRGEETTDGEVTGATDRDGIEMEDLGGDTQDFDGDNNETGSDDGSQAEVDDEVGETDPRDPGTVDEKLWGDETVPGETTEAQSSNQGSKEQNDTSEIVAKEDGEKPVSKQDGVELPPGEVIEESADLEDNEMLNDQPVDAGRQLDNFVPEVDTLELPDDLDLSPREDGQEGNQDTQEDSMDEAEGEQLELPASRDQEPELAQSSQEEGFSADPQDEFDCDSRETPIPDAKEHREPTTAQPDLAEGEDQTKESNIQNARDSLSNDTLQDAKNGVHSKLDAAAVFESTDRAEFSDSNGQADQLVFAYLALNPSPLTFFKGIIADGWRTERVE
jgi:midasin